MIAVVVAFVVVAFVLAAIPLFGWIADRRAAARRSPPPLLYPISQVDPRESLGAAHRHRTNGHGPHRSNGVTQARPQRNPSNSRADWDGAPPPPDPVCFVRPGDGPVQLLPGRLEVLAGETRHQE